MRNVSARLLPVRLFNRDPLPRPVQEVPDDLTVSITLLRLGTRLIEPRYINVANEGCFAFHDAHEPFSLFVAMLFDNGLRLIQGFAEPPLIHALGVFRVFAIRKDALACTALDGVLEGQGLLEQFSVRVLAVNLELLDAPLELGDIQRAS